MAPLPLGLSLSSTSSIFNLSEFGAKELYRIKINGWKKLRGVSISSLSSWSKLWFNSNRILMVIPSVSVYFVLFVMILFLMLSFELLIVDVLLFEFYSFCSRTILLYHIIYLRVGFFFYKCGISHKNILVHYLLNIFDNIF